MVYLARNNPCMNLSLLVEENKSGFEIFARSHIPGNQRASVLQYLQLSSSVG
jgi:hypothetical protein